MLDWFRNNKPVREKGYTTQLLGQDAVKYINEQDASKPFYLYLTFNAPHTPIKRRRITSIGTRKSRTRRGELTRA